ncbi:hypothetical protein PCASD_14691 [Puccinia coronata f. sp. avenae]|uniref:Uncharacterized protein n=1 Tax=Puccinia coronata f. sp. avenae TaxID=200324 RepID=A0A2N5TEE9_9BASI|nr:hypothetical protein PCASD_14691 [Puccinia coronata f. sp. avenae]
MPAPKFDYAWKAGSEGVCVQHKRCLIFVDLSVIALLFTAAPQEKKGPSASASIDHDHDNAQTSFSTAVLTLARNVHSRPVTLSYRNDAGPAPGMTSPTRRTNASPTEAQAPGRYSLKTTYVTQ